MSTNADVLREGIEKYNHHDVMGLAMVGDEVLDQGVATTRDDWRRKWEEQWAEIPDLRATIEVTAEDGDWVAHRYTMRGTGPDGGFEMFGLDLVRMKDGKIVEHWAAAAPFGLSSAKLTG